MATRHLPESPIGIFDSGLGGLTVLKSLEKILPRETYIYFGDTAHVPYGSKSVDAVIHYSRNIMDFFLTHNTKAVVIACNTASAVAYPELSSHYDIPLFDVVIPSVMHSNHISKTRKIGIIGTRSTIFSGAYKRSFADLKSNCAVMEISCPLFVPLIEEGWAHTAVAVEVARTYLHAFKETEIDTLILGCTHYSIMANTIHGAIENSVQLVYSGETVGNKLLSYLEKNNLKNLSTDNGKTLFYVSDFPQKFDELGGRFLGRKLEKVNHISLN